MKTRNQAVRTAVVTAVASAAILLAAFGLSLFLVSMRTPPALVTVEERALAVEVQEVRPQDVVVRLNGTGVVRVLDSAALAPEVAGRVVEVHPRLDVGEVIPEGEMLFRIDPRDYEARVQEARAALAARWNTVERLERQYGNDRQRRETLERNRELARAEFERLRQLFEEDEVGTRSGVEQAERAYNAAADQADLLGQAVGLYPVQIQEARNAAEAAEAQVALSEANLERTVVRAPFRGRIRRAAVKAGEYVTPGAPLVTLADDSVLEISVPLSSREARRWLVFEDGRGAAQGAGWFNRPAPVSVEIRWTEDSQGHVWQGTLHRVEQFDEGTRTLTVVVRVAGEQALALGGDGFPLVEGMFCFVSIPGKTLRGVFEIPSSALDFAGNVRVVEDNRLRTRPATAVYAAADKSYVSEGIVPGDRVIVTRLVNPLEGSLLRIVDTHTEAPAGS